MSMPQGRGSLVCCDFCAAAYHERCIPDNTPVPDLESDDPWRWASLRLTPPFKDLIVAPTVTSILFQPVLTRKRCLVCNMQVPHVLPQGSSGRQRPGQQ